VHAAGGDEPAEVGEPVPDFELRQVLGGDGRTRLSEFRGQPVLIADWTDMEVGLGAAKGAAKLHEELGEDGLVVLLHEFKRKDPAWMQGFALKNLDGTDAPLCCTQSFPIRYEENGFPPNVALIGVDGTLLAAGSYLVDLGRAGKLAKAELKRARSGWGEHPDARKARAEAFGRGELAAARARITAALAEEPEHAELLAVRDELETRFRTWRQSVEHRRERGDAVRARDAAELLLAAVEGDAEWEPDARALAAELATEDAQRELELALELDARLKAIRRKGPRDGDEEKLRELAAEGADTRVGARAARWADAVAATRGMATR
jgi:hypothetical protein